MILWLSRSHSIFTIPFWLSVTHEREKRKVFLSFSSWIASIDHSTDLLSFASRRNNLSHPVPSNILRQSHCGTGVTISVIELSITSFPVDSNIHFGVQSFFKFVASRVIIFCHRLFSWFFILISQRISILGSTIGIFSTLPSRDLTV